MSKELKPKRTNMLLFINEEVKRQFKAYCAKRDISMIDKIEEMMLEKIAEEDIENDL